MVRACGVGFLGGSSPKRKKKAPTLQDNVPDPGGAAGCSPPSSVFRDRLHHVPDGGARVIEDTCIVVLPKVPRREDDDGGKASAVRGRRVGEEEAHQSVVGGSCRPTPSEDLVPNLSQEGAPNQEMVHVFLLLITKGAVLLMG